MYTILAADDEAELLDVLELYLDREHIGIRKAKDGIEAMEIFRREEVHLVLLDIMMPGMDGFEVCRAIRDDVLCPVIFLSARQSETDKIRGLTLGGDDYITKPFGLQELMAKIEADLRRERRSQYMNAENKRSKLYFEKLCLDMRERTVRVDGKDIDLTKREYDIVELLALHAGQVFSREQIYEKVWGYDSEGNSSTVVERIKKIRAKFSAAADKEYISTVWGIGYKWNKT